MNESLELQSTRQSITIDEDTGGFLMLATRCHITELCERKTYVPKDVLKNYLKAFTTANELLKEIGADHFTDNVILELQMQIDAKLKQQAGGS